jgi:hypothetical protein
MSHPRLKELLTVHEYTVLPPDSQRLSNTVDTLERPLVSIQLMQWAGFAT